MPYADPEERREASRRYYRNRYQDPEFRAQEAERKGKIDIEKHARWTDTILRKLDRMIAELRDAGASEAKTQKIQAARE